MTNMGAARRVSFFGNITAEVIGATGGGTSLINLPQAVVGPAPAVNPDNSLFAIYVSQSDFTGGITLAQIPTSNFQATPPTTLPSTPFAGSLGTLSVENAQGNGLNTIAAPGNSGTAFIGAFAGPKAKVFPSQPVLTANVTQAFGVLPVSITNLNAGITVATGQNIGSILIGGTVTGEVHIGAAINTFYAGWLITGNTNGEFGTNTITDAQNFSVAGNIRNLYTSASIGTDSDAGLTVPTYVSGFDMHVGGTIGTVHSLSGSIVGAINSANLSGVPTNGANQQETEFISNTAPATDFFASVQMMTNDQVGGSALFQNDTFATAQYISNGYNALAATDNSVVVDGTIQNTVANHDKVDYYAVPLLAGQTITVRVTAQDGTTTGGVQTGVFDPNGREIVSDYNRPDNAVTQEMPFQFTTDQAGVYRFAVAPTGDSTFAGTSGITGDLPYTLTISNVGHMAIGAIVASANVCDNTAATVAGFGTLSDDLGAIVAGGSLVSASGDTVAVENGNLRMLSAGTIGSGSGSSPQLFVPNGNVGLVESTAGSMVLNNSGLTPVAIGGDYQLVSSAGNFLGQLIANGNIGTLRARASFP